MTETLDEKWGVTSGLPLADVDAEITGLEFGFNAKIGAGRMCANVEFTTVDDGETHDQSFTIGDGWEIAGKGASITGRKQLNSNSNWGRFANSCVDACGGPEAINKALPDTDYREAAGWLGTKWHLGTVEIEVYNPEKKETKKGNALVATAFLGVNGEAPKSAGKKSAGASGKGTAKAGKPGLADTNPELFAELVTLAGEHDDHDGFMAAALELEAVEGDALAMNAVMSTKAGSVWASK